MDIDDDDLYVPEEPKVESASPEDKPKTDDLEEGEEEDEGAAMDEDDDDDSDIDIITERKDGSKPAPPPQSKYSDIRNIPQRTASNDMAVSSAPVKKDEEESKQSAAINVAAPSADKTSEAASKSTIDINANPIHAASGKPITRVNIDEDLPDNDKPWRKPGTDISDYFNYGFDEFTWALYASKQETIRGEYGADTFAVNNKKMMDDFNMMMMGGMGMSGAGAGGAPGGMPGMDGMPPEMQAMMQQMMASGMDPSQMDPNQMNAMFASMQNGGAGQGGAQGGQGGQGGNFGGGFGGNQGGFGYDQGMSGGGGRGGFGGGRGRRGRW